MDTVRFGRVLGQGARHAAKTLLSAADAAAAPNPSATTPTPSRSAPPTPSAARPASSPAGAPSVRPPASTQTILPPSSTPRTRATAPASSRGLAEGSRRFGRAVWAPAVRLSGVLWLELTGVFFGLFALVAGIATWRLRTAFHVGAASDDHTRFLFAAGMVVVFGYFSASSFLKANRRGRRP